MIRAGLLLALVGCAFPPPDPGSEIQWVPEPPTGSIGQNAWAHPELYGEFYTPRIGVTGPVWIDRDWRELER